MFEFLKIQYRLGKITEVELTLAVTKGWLTEEQKEEILSEGGDI